MNSNNGQAGGQKDYLDKGLEAAQKKFGGAQGQKMSQNRGMNEKITDGARKLFEKFTGKKVNSKFSN
ncbi:uncharacterized protein K460DRAFT_368504 [Cucurbitaria berberidis CBS 394.84]|uniref:Uncharacterized protein n=1 Tax=Cucurbitaria berberidis CBS 394.84 TaxID=1168544 RepID=A0A9P4GE44_9PLEO|nr:uncharacterized protein K460DRAFT_368504 [Cucurbitaria berberidis CBS 394.84]KAF1843641.1 hypothetical protein K460DRAFT_368504 [Cucurbitaria berberidis CBS 394.84]